MASVDLQEKANFTRLSRLLVDKGTEALRNTFDAIHPPASLPVVLNANKKSLLRLKFRVINNSQWDLLFPSSGKPPDSKTFDVTLLTVLFRNICNLPTTGWDSMPIDTDRSTQANIVRIRSYRNEVYAHVTSTQVDNAAFEFLWQKITQALVELNIPQKDVDDLKNCSLGPNEEMYIEILKGLKSQEEESLKVLKSFRQCAEEKLDGIRQLCQSVFQEQQESKEQSQNPITRIERNRSKENDENLLQKLAKHNFKSKIRSKVKFFHTGTREWLLNKVDEWFIGNEHESRILLLTAGPGFGKSVFAAKVCEDFKNKRKLAACHFCDFNDSNLKNPMMMLQSLASQMCDNVANFRERLLDQLRRPHEVRSLKDAFGIYLQNPFDELEIEESSLVVIDGLDESKSDDKNEIVNLIADCFIHLPKCIKVLVTSRSEISIAKLKDVGKITDIESNDAENNSDLEIYLKACLPSLPDKKADGGPGVIETLVERCEGSFLYAFYAQSELQKRDDLDKVTLREIMKFLPKGLDSVYQAYFKRFEDELKAIIRGNLDILRVLEMLVASNGPLPLTFITQALDLAPDCRETKNIIKKVNVAVSCLLYVSDDCVTVFHKSVIDWLLAMGYQDHEYTVKISDGNKSLWLMCEQVFEKIKRQVCSGHELNLTRDITYALLCGHQHLVACDMKKNFFWLVDVVIIHILLIIFNEELDVIGPTLYLWKEILRVDAVISEELRARISWHIAEIEYIMKGEFRLPNNFRDRNISPFYYLESVVTHSPEGYFNDNEKKIAESILSEVPWFVDVNCTPEVDVMPLAIRCLPPPHEIRAVGVSHNKTMAAVAQKNGRITLVRVPILVDLWHCSTEYKSISCCTFDPNDSFVLFGKLESVINIAERKEVPFFYRSKETFVSCAFSPNGKRLVTSNGSRTIKLWDVAKQRLLSLLCAKSHVNWCCFTTTGLFIIGDRIFDLEFDNEHSFVQDPDNSNFENWEFDADGFLVDDLGYDTVYSFVDNFDLEDPFCVWNAITLQRSDERIFPDFEEEGNALQSKVCKCCFPSAFKMLPRHKKLYLDPVSHVCPTLPTGIYNGVECSFALEDRSFSVIENTHFTTLAAWNFFVLDFHDYDSWDYESESGFKGSRQITAIENDQWLYADVKNLFVFRTVQTTYPTRVLGSSFCPDGSRLATCTSDGCINIWNVDSGKVEQRCKTNQVKSLFVCWWSENFLFVFDFSDRIPSLSKYPVDVDLKILFIQGRQVPLCHLADEFLPLSAVVDFSEGFLCYQCGETLPVKVLDVNGMGGARMVTLPGIEHKMSITVSPGARFIFGGAKVMFYIWKRNATETAVYEVFFTYQQCTVVSFYRHTFTSCFSSDSKVAVVAWRQETAPGRPLMHGEIIDLDTGSQKSVPFNCFYDDMIMKLFCIYKDRVVIVLSYPFIRFFDMDSGAHLGSSFQHYFRMDFESQTKLSPNGTTLALPKINGNMEFLRLSTPQSPLLSRIKRKAATGWDNFRSSSEW